MPIINLNPTTPAPKPKKALQPVHTLQCACCGESCRGRQWWNRDTGFGLCVPCLKWHREVRHTPEKEIENNYGIEGIHFNVEEEKNVKN